MAFIPEIANERISPSLAGAIVFRWKTALFQMKRATTDLFNSRIKKHRKQSKLRTAPIIAASKTKLWTEVAPAERYLVAGKIHNLRLAVAKLEGLEIPAGNTFSFWKQVGRTSRVKGFAVGRELREGCIIPNIGGGLCQISNALFDAALQAEFEIVERHAHSQVIPGSVAEKGRDATVFWNYVDLRFSSVGAFRIEASLDGENLTLQFRAERNAVKRLQPIARKVIHAGSPNSCASCDQGDCHRVVNRSANADFGRSAFLVDEFTPEFDRYISEIRTTNDVIMMPLDGRRFRKANYAWTARGFGSVKHSVFVTAVRSYRSRRLSAQGAARQLNLLKMYEQLAASYARRLGPEILHLVVQQNLLPFLWKSGHLGGRTFDVLMTAMPMTNLQESLDHASSLHPESPTLSDFRADPDLVAVEMEALRHARKIVTPHTAIARLFPKRAGILDWKQPQIAQRKAASNAKMRVVFPASTVGRKGCYELRDAMRGIDAKLILLGPIIEKADFWGGFAVEQGGNDWLQTADIVVLPAFVEHRPRRLLLAASCGIPVIASEACGVSNVAGIRTIEAGDSASLRSSILIAFPSAIR